MDSKVTYRQQFTRCGKQRCRKCGEGAGHGPYWYAYWSEKGRTVSKYIGVHLPPHVEGAQQGTLKERGSKTAEGATAQNTHSPVLRVYMLGQFRVERESEGEWRAIDNPAWHGRPARALLGCLLSSAGRRLRREQVMEFLWPHLDRDVATNRLNSAVHELRQILEPDIVRPAASRMLRLEQDILRLADSSQIWLDAEAFEHLLKEAASATDPEQAGHLLEKATSLYRGSYLPEELYSEWAAHRRDTLQQKWGELLLNLANLRAKRGAFVGAIEILDRLHTAEPMNEAVLQRLMIFLAHLGRRGEALQVYLQHVKMLQRDYESDPFPETRELYEALCLGHIPTAYDINIVKTHIDTVEGGEAHRTHLDITSPDAEHTAANQEISFSRPMFEVDRHNQSPLVGRDQECESMRRIMLSVEERLAQHAPGPRQPHFLLLTGEAGIGKTRLAEELSLQAYTRGWAVAWSRAHEQESALPYYSWTELLRTLLQGTSTLTAPPNGSDPLYPSHLTRERLSGLLPMLAPHTPLPSTKSAISPKQERLHLWEATLELLSTLSAMYPLLLALDDLQWTDDSSLELLAYLAYHLRDQRIVLVGTCREEELAPTHKLRILIEDLRREQALVTLPVQPLTQSQIGTLVAHLPKDIVQSIRTQAAGNPFFAEELARSIGSDVSRLESSLPEAITAVFECRLSRLGGECQTLLEKAAGLGASFELSRLLPMAHEYTEDTILDLLEEALHAGLLIEEGTGAHITYHFWHPLIVDHLQAS